MSRSGVSLRPIVVAALVVGVGFAGLTAMYAQAGGSPGAPQVQKLHDTTITLAFASEPVRTGEQALTLTLQDPSGAPVPTERVAIRLTPPAEMSDGHGTAESGAQDTAGDAHDSAGTNDHGMSADAHAQMETGDHAPTAAQHSADTEPPEATAGHAHDAEAVAPEETVLVNGPATGHHQGRVHFTHAGRWHLEVETLSEGKMVTARFDVPVTSAGPNWTVLGGLLTVNVIVIAVAGLRRYQTSAFPAYREVRS